MSKKIKLSSRPAEPVNSDAWVNQRIVPEESKPTIKPKRLTVDIEPHLHRRLRLHCLQQDVSVTQFVCDLIIKTLPNE